jgi:hypothetical protein
MCQGDREDQFNHREAVKEVVEREREGQEHGGGVQSVGGDGGGEQ